MSDEPKESLLKFPCDFTIKVFGKDNDEFEVTVLSIIRDHVKTLPEDAIQTRKSENGNYLAMSITMYVTSREQLDNIYRALSSAPQVLMVL